MATLTSAAADRLRRGARARTSVGSERRLPFGRQLLLHAFLLMVTATVLFPIAWILSMSLDPRGLSRPQDLTLIPPGATLDAFAQVIEQPTANPVSLPVLMFNSFKLAIGSAAVSLALGVLAAYAFSRLRFRFRQTLMIVILGVLMLPAIATIAPLFVQLNRITLGDFNLRNSLFGVGLAIVSGALPFAIWNLKGYLDTIPRELEEAATIDGATRNQVFVRIILPLATPALAVTGFLGFVAGYTEYYFSWTFLRNPEDFTLAMALASMVGQFARTTPWSEFAAFALLFAAPVSIVFLLLQRYIVSGLAIGGVKG
ncbi:MAG: ABC transporter permease subunit [Chloroflexota bacterium]|nr:ABC transporter permease subunit [Chloroflexota bacterium]